MPQLVNIVYKDHVWRCPSELTKAILFYLERSVLMYVPFVLRLCKYKHKDMLCVV